MTTQKTIGDLLSAEFDPSEVRHFTGRGNQVFDYVEDETVMDRLDMVLGPGRWNISTEPISVADGIVKVVLHGMLPDGTMFSYEDFGYQTRDGGESLKEAVSDGIRRCGRYLGVGRYLYRKHEPIQSGGRATPPPARPPARPTVVHDDVPEEPADLFPPIGGAVEANVPTDHCPLHDVPWLGTPGDYWHKDPDGRYCRHPDNVRKARRA